MHLSHHASISYALHTLCGHASILRASIFCAHFFPFSANTSTASSGEHWRVLVRTHMLAACAQCLLHARYMLAASFLQALASILSRAYFYKGRVFLLQETQLINVSKCTSDLYGIAQKLKTRNYIQRQAILRFFP